MNSSAALKILPAIELNAALSFATRANLEKSASYQAIRGVRHIVCRNDEGRWTAIIVGSGMEENAAWFGSARADGVRFMWVA